MEHVSRSHVLLPSRKAGNLAIRPAVPAPAPVLLSRSDVGSQAYRFLQLQGKIGNRAVQQLIQAKLQVSQPGDLYEQEADHVAQRIMSMPARAADRKSSQESTHGVLPGAETVLSAASSSAGQPLPVNLRRKFEHALGVDLSGVRTHTGPESANANKAISARAYTTGSDIHFNESQYNPDTSEGQHLLAHEVTHVVQQSGGILRKDNPDGLADDFDGTLAVSRLGSASDTGTISRQLVQREPDNPFLAPGIGFNTSHSEDRPSDMVEFNWDVMAAPSRGPRQPRIGTINIGPVPKTPPSTKDPFRVQAPSDCKQHSCHDIVNQPRGFDPNLMIEMERATDWQALKGVVARTDGIFNRTVPLITKYNVASNDPVLADLYGVPASGPGDLAGKVEGKIVGGKNDPSGTTVGALFGAGTSVDTKDIQGNVSKAAHGDVNSPLVSAIAAFKASDHDFNAESANVDAANKAALAAANEAEAAHFLKEEAKAGEEKEHAEKELAEVKEKAESVKKYIGWAIKGITFVAGLALAPEVVIPAAAAEASTQLDLFPPDKPATPEAGKEEKKGGLPEGAGEKATWVAEKAVDFWYASDLAKASAHLSAAIAAMKAAHAGYLDANELGKVNALASALSKVTAAVENLKSKIIRRRDAYRAIAREAAAAGGGTPKQQQKLQSVIMAIPACETVVTATSNILDSIEEVPYSKDSGIAAGMANASGNAVSTSGVKFFTESLGWLKGYKNEFHQTNKLWTERLVSARQILTQLGKDRA